MCLNWDGREHDPSVACALISMRRSLLMVKVEGVGMYDVRHGRHGTGACAVSSSFSG